ncbi:GAF domain-containing protein [Oscillatoriales cyanobacterium LEGE 11467]|uniref:GAF domain-containing protein n=1 Tax=Zarconia navalis LEGE 11467 TaxID=1828826 RepID=A0A928Z7Y3_9CYAN|nr:GAF domain-containing protein [Zarconia navalis]MBE9041902.1 GAF domain-containing protein [Zarconia navalis LEGE 11467]
MKQEVADLNTIKMAFQAQTELLRTWVTTARTASNSLILRSLSQQILKSSTRLTNAESSSLFLLNLNGVVIESVLARGATIVPKKSRLIGQVLERGLAGWVHRNRQIGLVTDTTHDDRWLTMSDEPYTARSALCVPIFRGKTMLAIVTLMHSQPAHFRYEAASLMKLTAAQISLVLEGALLYVENHNSVTPSTTPPIVTFPPEVQSIPPTPTIVTSNGRSPSHTDVEAPISEKFAPDRDKIPQEFNLSKIGLYTIVWDGKFLYANPRLAQIFDYSFGELVELESIFGLISEGDYDFFSERVYRCIRAQSKHILCEVKGKKKDGKTVDIEIYGSRTKFYGKSVIIGAIREL